MPSVWQGDRGIGVAGGAGWIGLAVGARDGSPLESKGETRARLDCGYGLLWRGTRAP